VEEGERKQEKSGRGRRKEGNERGWLPPKWLAGSVYDRREGWRSNDASAISPNLT